MRAIVLLVLASAFLATNAAAQSSRWTDPTATWSMDFNSSNWGNADVPPPPAGPTLLIAPLTPPPDNETRLCMAEQSFTDLAANVNPTAVRLRGSLIDQAKVQEIFPNDHFTQVHISHVRREAEDIAVITAMSGTNRVRARAFVTPAGNRAVTVSIMCISVPGMRADADAEVDTILNSIQFPQ